MALSDIGLCARALIKIGAHPIAAFDEGTVEAEVASHLYAPVRDMLLSAHPWRFARTQARLMRLADAPTADFAYAYQLPKDFLRALSLGHGGRGRGTGYVLRSGVLETDLDQAVLTYVARRAESTFPAYFDMALIARLAAEFCIPLTESATRADMLMRRADEELKAARLIDSQQAEPPRLEDFTLIEVRG